MTGLLPRTALSRSRLCGEPRPGGARSAGRRGGHAPPRRNRPRPARLPRPLGGSLPLRLRRLEARLPSPRGGAAAASNPRAACSCRSSSRVAPTRRSSSPTATRSTGISARHSRLRSAPARPSRRTTDSAGIRLQPLATLHAEGKVSTLPAVGYTDPDQSHFTSRHWEVGATSASFRTGWIGRYLDRRRHCRQPAPGPLARLVAPAPWRRAACRSPRWRARTATTSGPGTSGARSRRGCAAIGSLGAAHAKSSDAALRAAGKVVRFSPTGSAGSSAASTRRRAPFLSDGTASPSAWPRSPR